MVISWCSVMIGFPHFTGVDLLLQDHILDQCAALCSNGVNDVNLQIWKALTKLGFQKALQLVVECLRFGLHGDIHGGSSGFGSRRR